MANRNRSREKANTLAEVARDEKRGNVNGLHPAEFACAETLGRTLRDAIYAY